MARTRSGHVTETKAALLARLDGLRPGARFLSAREVAAAYGVSYQTAHRLLDELCAEGRVERRAASGTYAPSGDGAADAPSPYAEAWLIFDGRARRAHSFGARLLAELGERLKRDGTPWQVCWAENAVAGGGIPPDAFPVLWEAPAVLETCRRAGRRALLLNARPAPGLDAAPLDSVAVDDAFGGACAADLLRADGDAASDDGAGRAVIAGPRGDPRSDDRVRGFLARAPGAAVIDADGWYAPDGVRVAAAALAQGPRGLFCANDRLAEGVLTHCERAGLPRPRLVGFDDAPVAAARALSTIAIPWEELAADAAEIVRRRLSGDVSAARRRIITPRPVVRTL